MNEEDLKELLDILKKDGEELIKEAEPFIDEINDSNKENNNA